MYAVISTGGKQYRVTEGERLEVERLAAPGGATGTDESGDSEISLRPVLMVDGDTVLAAPADLADATVKARVLGEAKGPKIRGFTYKPKTNNRRHWGHRQKYSTIEITTISRPGGAKEA